jgi:hypothetical protein
MLGSPEDNRLLRSNEVFGEDCVGVLDGLTSLKLNCKQTSFSQAAFQMCFLHQFS